MRDAHAVRAWGSGTRVRVFIGAAVVLLLVIATVGAGRASAVEQGRTTVSYRAQLTGSGEVPPVDTVAFGRAGLRLAVEADFLAFELQVADIEDVLASHIHVGPAGQNGPIVAFLYQGVEPTDFEKASIASGRIMPSDLLGPLAGDWEGFVAAVRTA